MAGMKDDKSLVFLISAGRAFHSRDPAAEKALSPNCVFVPRMSYSAVIAERSRRSNKAIMDRVSNSANYYFYQHPR